MSEDLPPEEVPFVPQPNVWYDMKERPAPVDDRQFLVGRWVGETFSNEDYTKTVWNGLPTWQQDISHDENYSSKYNGYRGWNHRNGPFNGDATHWMLCPEPPVFEGLVAVKYPLDV